MNFERKVRILSVFVFFVFAAVWLRLAFWQTFASEGLSVAADSQHYDVLAIPAKRGEIKFHDGETLVADRNAWLLYANLDQLKSDKTETANFLAEQLLGEVPQISSTGGQLQGDEKEQFLKKTKGELEDKIKNRLNLEGSTWVNLAHFMPDTLKKRVEERNIKGLGFLEEETRDYPEASLAAHLIGFVGSDRVGNPKGYFGLEGYYQRELAGKNGQLRLEKDAFGQPIAIGNESRREKQDGSVLVTTIDRAVQFFVEKELEKGISDWKATGGTAIVMDPQNGAILAMSSFPSYDPRNFSYFPTKNYKNPAVASLYEPGSIMKPLVVAAAINEGKIQPDTKCPSPFCDHPREIGGAFIHTFNNQYHPNLTMTETLINSDNTGMVYIGEQLGFEKLYDYYLKFGFNEKTGIDLEEEESGNLRPKDNYYLLDQATLTFGQGVAVNAMQMMRAWAPIANGGNLVTPHLVSQIQTGNEKIDLSWPKGDKVLSSTTTKLVAEMLVRVANESPVHFPKDRIVNLAKFRIAAKSGTAQIALGGAYKSAGTIASVIGFAPADNPKFLVMVKLNEPEVRPWGSDTAGPVFFAIMNNLLTYYNVAP